MLSRRDLLRLGTAQRGCRGPARGPHRCRSPSATALPPGDGPTGPASPPVTPFAATLPDPDAARPDAGRRRRRLTTTSSCTRRTSRLLPGRKTRMLTYNGTFPGPMIVATLDRAGYVTYHNQLVGEHDGPQPRRVRQRDSDGHPDDAILPGTSKTCFYPNTSEKPPDDIVSHTQWFHDHVEHATAVQRLPRAGRALPVQGPEGRGPEPAVGRGRHPARHHGQALQLRQLAELPVSGTTAASNGILGDVMQVNGAPQPRLAVERRKYRFRVLNALRRAEPRARAELERAAHGHRVRGGLPRAAGLPALRVHGARRALRGRSSTSRGTRSAPASCSRTCRAATGPPTSCGSTSSATPSTRAPCRPACGRSRIPEAQATVRRRFVFERDNGQWVINGKTFDPNRIDAQPRVGDTEIWTLENKSRRLAPPDPHPPAQLPGARPEREAAAAPGVRLEGDGQGRARTRWSA